METQNKNNGICDKDEIKKIVDIVKENYDGFESVEKVRRALNSHKYELIRQGKIIPGDCVGRILSKVAGHPVVIEDVAKGKITVEYLETNYKRLYK